MTKLVQMEEINGNYEIDGNEEVNENYVIGVNGGN